MPALAEHFGLDDATLWHALRPLHDGAVHDETVGTMMRMLWAQAELDGPYASLAIDHGTIALVSTLVSLARGNGLADPSKPLHTGDRRLQRVLDYVEVHLDRPLRLLELARVAGISATHLSRTFRVAFDVSVHDHVQRRRVHRAKAVLLSSATPLAEVALACGFANQTHMTRVFRDVLGTTPGAVRRSRD